MKLIYKGKYKGIVEEFDSSQNIKNATKYKEADKNLMDLHKAVKNVKSSNKLNDNTTTTTFSLYISKNNTIVDKYEDISVIKVTDQIIKKLSSTINPLSVLQSNILIGFLSNLVLQVSQ